jgi:hypothetical protein
MASARDIARVPGKSGGKALEIIFTVQDIIISVEQITRKNFKLSLSGVANCSKYRQDATCWVSFKIGGGSYGEGKDWVRKR